MRRAGWVLGGALLCLALVVGGWVRAGVLLLRFGGVDSVGAWFDRPVQVHEEVLAVGNGAVRARLYEPSGSRDAPCMVILHGIHHQGVDEPRLKRLAGAMAKVGVRAYTPEVKELTEYRIESSSVETIGEAAKALARRCDREQVGVLGVSFAGGLALLAAADLRYRDVIGFTVTVGAHHDLERVGRFFVNHRAENVEGSSIQWEAHEYGLLVLLHGAAEVFFSAEDAAPAREALRRRLGGDPAGSREVAARLSEGGRRRLDLVLAGQGATLAAEVTAALAASRGRLSEVSPGARLGQIQGAVFVLHGADDPVIPPTEALWLGRSLRPSQLRSLLVSPALQHAGLQGGGMWLERLRLLEFLAGVLEEAERMPMRQDRGQGFRGSPGSGRRP